MLRRVGQVLDSDDALQDFLGFRVTGRRGYDPGAVDEIDPAHEGDVLPDFGLSRDRRGLADGLLLERVDDRRLADVGVADKADRDLLLVREQGRELPEELDQAPLAERVVDRRVERDRRVRLGQDLDPAGGDPPGHEVDFVEHVDDFFAALLLGEVRLDRVTPGSERVASVEDVQDHVGRVDDLCVAARSALVDQAESGEKGKRTLYNSDQIRLLVPALRM